MPPTQQQSLECTNSQLYLRIVRWLFRMCVFIGLALEKARGLTKAYGPFPFRSSVISLPAHLSVTPHSGTVTVDRSSEDRNSTTDNNNDRSKKWFVNGVLTNNQIPIQTELVDLDDAINAAFLSGRPLLVFVHSELCRASQDLLAELLHHSEALDYIKQEYTFYAVSVFSAEAARLKCADNGCFPQVCAMAALGGTQGVAHIASIEGSFNAVALLDFMVKTRRKYLSMMGGRPRSAETVV